MEEWLLVNLRSMVRIPDATNTYNFLSYVHVVAIPFAKENIVMKRSQSLDNVWIPQPELDQSGGLRPEHFLW